MRNAKISSTWLISILFLFFVASLAESAEKTKIGIMKFEVAKNLDPSFGTFLYNSLLARMVSSGKYTVLDWEEIGRVLKYIEQSQPNVSGDEARRQAINQLGIQKMYVGSVTKIGSKYYLTVKVLNLDLTVEKVVQGSTESEDDLEAIINTLSSKLIMSPKQVVEARDVAPSQKIKAGSKARLYVKPDPPDARVRILNIKPSYRDGIELDAGRYHIEVSKKGFGMVRNWVSLGAGEDKNLEIHLGKAKLKYLVPVPGAKYAPLRGLSAGSREAQGWQRKAVEGLGLPLEARTRKTGIVFRLIPGGSFMMGSPSSESGRASDEGPAHRVMISKPLYVGKFEITQAQWQAVMGNNPSDFKNSGSDAPVEQVSWNDCIEFCRYLCHLEGVPTMTFRLLTEAEWEYACRAGTMGPYAGDLGWMGWYKGNSGEKTHKVGVMSPNAWGLYDMHGNVWEWCQDWYGDNLPAAITDPRGPTSGSYRVLRGGSWCSEASDCRSAGRNWSGPGRRGGNGGFRFVVPLGD